jgi:eukaryotic-like serine/threonine-protein kinase
VSERSSVVPPPPDWRRSEAPTAPVGTTLPSSTATDGAAEGPARHPSFHPGARITEKYVVEYLIGQGEVGVVVAAKHVHLDQQVAIKCMRPTPPGTKDPSQHFLREARLVAQIRSEHLVHVHEVGTLPEGEP